MVTETLGIEDIFKGAEKIEVLGKLPALLWAYIDSARKISENIKTGTGNVSESVGEMNQMLWVLNSAAGHLGNNTLKELLSSHDGMLEALNAGSMSREDFARSMTDTLPKFERVAGPRREPVNDSFSSKALFERELGRAEKVKTGRSKDIVVSVDIVDDVRNYLVKEVLTEGISSVLVIDNAGSLIANVGSKVDLDAVSLAAVAAANFAATEQIARLIGERDFVLLFYKGRSESFHFTRVGNDYIIVTIFNNSLSLGLLRLKIAEVAQALEKKLPEREG